MHSALKQQAIMAPKKSRFSPKCKWCLVLVGNCRCFSLANSRKPQPYPFSSTALHFDHLQDTRIAHCNWFTVLTC